MIAAIGSDGTRPVVWGVGRTERSARRDAESGGGDARCCVEVDRATVARIRRGEIHCAALGILVTISRNGEWTASVEVRSDSSRSW